MLHHLEHQTVREMAEKGNGLDGKETVVLDFSGIDTVTNSFADECIAKLLLEMSLDELKAKTTFTGLTPMTERSILTALKRRQIQILQNQ